MSKETFEGGAAAMGDSFQVRVIYISGTYTVSHTACLELEQGRSLVQRITNIWQGR